MSSSKTPGKSRYTRPDASMSLLVDMMTNSVDAGYAQATARRAVRGDTGLNKGFGARSLAVVGVALIAVIFTISALEVQAAAPQAERDRHELVERIHSREASVDELQRAVEAVRDEVDSIQDSALPKGATDRVRLLGLISGSDPVEGPGIKIVADDAKASDTTDDSVDPREAEALANGRVLDRDLQRLVNGLWNVGAEAIAINGQRLTALSAIRAAGASILVDNRPLAPPYTVLAIGDAKRMRVDFPDGADGRYLRSLQENYGIRMSVETQKKISLPPAIGTSLRYATAIGTEAPAAPTVGTGGPTPGARPSTQSPQQPERKDNQ